MRTVETYKGCIITATSRVLADGAWMPVAEIQYWEDGRQVMSVIRGREDQPQPTREAADETAILLARRWIDSTLPR